jgi:ribosomal protein L7/L12
MSEPTRASTALPAAVRDALHRGNLVEAIKLMRSASGLSLKDVKDELQEYPRGNNPASKAPPGFPAPSPGGPLPPDVVQAVQQGNKIEAIRRLRLQTGIELKQAKDAVDAYIAMHRVAGDLSPGQVPASGRSSSRVALLVITGVAIYLLLRYLGYF